LETHTIRRTKTLEEKKLHFVGMGVSGGEEGALKGPSLMPGGSDHSWNALKLLLEKIAAKDFDGNGCVTHIGTDGAGHFVKMVHNAIEYGMMQSLAEGYRVLREGPYKDLDLAAAGDVWQQSSVVTSWLNDLTRQALHENPNMDGIEGVVAESGEARWTLETAKDNGIPMPAIQAAFDVRLASQQGHTDFSTKLLAAMRNKFGGHDINGRQ
jgi:6-phosphogluconate dehydrogenase